MYEKVVFLLSLIGWLFIVLGLVKSCKALGEPVIGGSMKPLLPWVHANKNGRNWALLYWGGIVWVLVAYSELFKNVQLVPAS